MIDRISEWLHDGADGIEWLILEMDLTQWGIVSVVFVVIGFLALRTRI